MDWRVMTWREGNQLKNCGSNPGKTSLRVSSTRTREKGEKIESP